MEDEKLDRNIKGRFEKAEQPLGGNQWDKMAVSLNKKMFYRFAWNRFNIYYFSALIINGALSLGLLGYVLFGGVEHNSKKEIASYLESQDNIIEIVEVDTQYTKETLVIDSTVYIYGNSNSTAMANVLASNENTEGVTNSMVVENQMETIPEMLSDTALEVNNEVTVPVNDTVANSTSTVETEEPVEPVKTVIVKRKKTFVVATPKDTVYNIDTVNVEK